MYLTTTTKSTEHFLTFEQKISQNKKAKEKEKGLILSLPKKLRLMLYFNP